MAEVVAEISDVDGSVRNKSEHSMILGHVTISVLCYPPVLIISKFRGRNLLRKCVEYVMCYVCSIDVLC